MRFFDVSDELLLVGFDFVVFEEFYMCYVDALFGFFVCCTCDVELAVDLMVETFVVVFLVWWCYWLE